MFLNSSKSNKKRQKYDQVVDELSVKHKGYLKVKTNNLQFNYSFVVLKQSKNFKYYLECYKDDSLSSAKLLFIIDMDFVEQIDVKEGENLIYLKGHEHDLCILDTTTNTNLNQWLTTLCKSCGFNQTTHNSIKSLSRHSKDLNNLLILLKSSSISLNKNAENDSSFKKSNLTLSMSNNGSLNGKLSAKPIAGIASTLVGSIDQISNVKIETFLKKITQQNYNDNFNESYLNLDECLSGNDEIKNKPVTLEPPFKLNKLPSYVSHSVCYQNEDANDILNKRSNSKPRDENLRYVELEVAQTTEHDTSLEAVSENLSTVSSFKFSQTDILGASENSNDLYTKISDLRTQALKNAISNVKFNRSN